MKRIDWSPIFLGVVFALLLASPSFATASQQATQICTHLHARLYPSKTVEQKILARIGTIKTKKLREAALSRWTGRHQRLGTKLKQIAAKYGKQKSLFLKHCSAHMTPLITKRQAYLKKLAEQRKSPAWRLRRRAQMGCERLYRYVKKNPGFPKKIKNKERKALLSKKYSSEWAFLKACLAHKAKVAKQRLAWWTSLNCSKWKSPTLKHSMQKA